MMGLSRIGIITKQLIEGVMKKSTPVAVIQNGTTPKHKMVVGTLNTISNNVKKEKISPPANIIIGDVVSLHKIIGWKN